MLQILRDLHSGKKQDDVDESDLKCTWPSALQNKVCTTPNKAETNKECQK